MEGAAEINDASQRTVAVRFLEPRRILIAPIGSFQETAGRKTTHRAHMGGGVTLTLGALAVFQLKHFLCDFVLQTQSQIEAKSRYGHPGGVVHAGLHCLGSLPALLVVSARPLPIGGLLICEFLIHYHSDWGKARLDRRYALMNSQARYWILFGLDQLIHQMTYLAMVFLVFYEGWARV
jgi:hypothetical protein